MLTPEEIHDIQHEAAAYADKQALCIDAMKIVQRRRGYVSDESLRDIGALLAMSPDEVESVATFYNLIFRHQVGRHTLLVCNSASCWIMGYPRLLAALRDTLGVDVGQTTTDARFTLLPIPCLGACDKAPALMIDDDLHGNVTAESLDAVLARYE